VIAELARTLAVPVVGNGDVGSAGEAVGRLRDAGVAGAMIGRAALGSPWIFGQAERLLRGEPAGEPPDPAAIGVDLVGQIDDLEEVKGGKVAVFESRKFVAWASRGMTGATEFRRRIQEIRDLRALRGEVLRFFSGTRRRDPEGGSWEPMKGGEWDERVQEGCGAA
jgi:tRNA-dihydrouridine synthase B